MERERKLMTKKILDLTLEIIYLLSGEEYTVVKKISGDHVTSGKHSCVLGGWNRRQSPLVDSINNSWLPRRHNDKRILEVTNMIIELLTGEVLTVCQDVTLSLSMEEGETLEEHKDPYEDAVMEDQPPLSLDGSRNPPVRCHSPLYPKHPTLEGHKNSNDKQGKRRINMKIEATGREDGIFLWTNLKCKGKKAIASRPTNKSTQDRGTSTSSSQEHHQTPHYYQAQSLINIKVEKTEREEDTCLWTDGKCKQKNLPKGGPSNRSPSERYPSSLYTPDSTQKHQESPHHYQDKLPINVKTESTEGEEMCSWADVQHKEKKISMSGPLTRSPLEGCDSPLYSQDSLQELPNIPQYYQEEDLIEYKSKDIESSDQMQCKEEEIPAEIGADGRYMRYNAENCSVINEDGRVEDVDLLAGSSEETPISTNVQPAAQWADVAADLSAHVMPVPDLPPPVTHTYRRRGETFLCPDCGECFTQRAKLFRHQKTHTVEMPYTCLECGKCFAEKVHLVNHERCHKVEKPYACSFCGKCFGEKGNLSNHERSHRKEKMFFCYDCGKCFTQRGHFNRHQRIHTGEKPYSCPECGKCFSQSEYLVRHQRCHSGEKPFTCLECGKCFTDKYDLAKHERIHGTNRPFYCSVCGKGFNQKSNLSRHERVHAQIIAVSME